MGGAAKLEDEELITAINVTPLVDIVLVLLIVLMVTSSYLVSKSINVELPTTAGLARLAPEKDAGRIEGPTDRVLREAVLGSISKKARADWEASITSRPALQRLAGEVPICPAGQSRDAELPR